MKPYSASSKLEERISLLEHRVEDLLRRKRNPHVRMAESVTGIVGLRETLTSENYALRFVWTIVFLTGVTATGYFIYSTTIEYLDNPLSTTIKLNVSPAYDIPRIGLCPAGWFDAEKVLQQGLSSDALLYSLGYIDTYSFLHIGNISQAKADFLSFYESQNFSTLLDYFHFITINLSTLSSTDGLDYNLPAVKIVDDQPSSVIKAFLSYQVCYTYQYRPTDRSSQSTTVTTVQFFDKSNGIVPMSPGLWIQYGFDLNFLGPKFPSIFLPSHTRSKIIISAKRFITLNKHGRRICKEKKDTNGNYSSTTCLAGCQNTYYKKIIKCQLFRYTQTDQVGGPEEYCNTFEPLGWNNSDWKFAHFESSNMHKNFTNLCLDSCPPRCDKLTYQGTVQWQQAYPLGDQEKDRLKKKTYVVFSVEHIGKYEGETVALEEVHAYSFTELVNNVGGTLGLFVGATVMTFVQIFLFFVSEICRTGRP